MRKTKKTNESSTPKKPESDYGEKMKKKLAERQQTRHAKK